MKGRKKKFLVVVFAILLYFVAFGVVNALNLPYKSIIQIFLFFIVALAVYAVVKTDFSSYECIVSEENVIFTSRIGNIERPIVTILASNINFIAPTVHKCVKEIKENKTYNLLKDKQESDDVYAIVFEDEKNCCCKLIFKATDKALQKLREAGACVIDK